MCSWKYDVNTFSHELLNLTNVCYHFFKRRSSLYVKKYIHLFLSNSFRLHWLWTDFIRNGGWLQEVFQFWRRAQFFSEGQKQLSASPVQRQTTTSWAASKRLVVQSFPMASLLLSILSFRFVLFLHLFLCFFPFFLYFSQSVLILYFPMKNETW